MPMTNTCVSLPSETFPARAGQKGWRVEDIDFSLVQSELVREDEQLFYLLVSASFVEILADLYADNLIAHFEGDPATVAWLENNWKREEVQHGHAFKAYVQAVWPEFDWEGAYAGFAVEYGAVCTVDLLDPSQALEMAARCVVETGTSTLYRGLFDYTREPVLRKLLTNIRADEVRHYTAFRRYFEECNRKERLGWWRVARAMLGRALEAHDEDAYIAFKHAYMTRHPDTPFNDAAWRAFVRGLRKLVRRHYPYRMAIKMLLAPIPVGAKIKSLVGALMAGVAGFALRGER